MKKLIWASVAIFVTLVVLALRPISVSRENSRDITGIVSSVTEGGYKDAVFSITGLSQTYYINRAFVYDFELNDLKKRLLGKRVTISFAKHWTALDPFNRGCKHITELKAGQELIFTEFK